MDPNILLFDVDGVLVQPGGYRAAVRATLNHFTGMLGFGEIAPDDQTIAIFEAHGITCEWDMVPITLAIILDRAAAQTGTMPPLTSFQAACAWFQEQKLPSLEVDFAAAFLALEGLSGEARPGEPPADTLLRLCEAGLGRRWLPNLAGQEVLRELLAHSRQPARSRTTNIFETFVLGDVVYSRALRLPAELRSESLLALHDQPLLSARTRHHLLSLHERQGLHLSAYTARPSTPLVETEEPLAVYGPDGEMALLLVGLENIPLIGSGQMGQIARVLGENEEHLIKPSPYHALAAIAAAWTGHRPTALGWTMAVFRHFERGETAPSLETGAGALPERLTLHIFEDSPAGMRGGKAAVEILRELGVQVELKLWGVSDHAMKIRALEQEGARVVEDVNHAVRLAVEGL